MVGRYSCTSNVHEGATEYSMILGDLLNNNVKLYVLLVYS